MKKTLRDSGTFGKGPINVVLRARKEFELILNKWVVHVVGLLSFISLCSLGNEISKSLMIAMISFLIIGFYSINRKRNKNDSLWLFSYIMFWVSLNIEYWLSNNYIICFIFVILGFVMILIIYKVEYSNVFLFTFCILVSYFLGEPIMVGVLYVYSRDLIYFF